MAGNPVIKRVKSKTQQNTKDVGETRSCQREATRDEGVEPHTILRLIIKVLLTFSAYSPNSRVTEDWDL